MLKRKNLQPRILYWARLSFRIEGEKKKLRKNPVYNCIQKKENPRNKFNQEGERPVHWKLCHWLKKLKKTQINGKIVHVYGLEESILLKYPFYPEQSICSMQSLSKFQ